jgi:hypothetical protein
MNMDYTISACLGRSSFSADMVAHSMITAVSAGLGVGGLSLRTPYYLHQNMPPCLLLA